jgi:hypothetical protein
MYHHVCCLYSEGINNEYLVEENKLDFSDDVFLLEIYYILRYIIRKILVLLVLQSEEINMDNFLRV